MAIFRLEQKLIGISKSFEIFAQALADLAYKIIIIMQPIIFFDCVCDVLFWAFFFWQSLNGVHDKILDAWPRFGLAGAERAWELDRGATLLIKGLDLFD